MSYIGREALHRRLREHADQSRHRAPHELLYVSNGAYRRSGWDYYNNPPVLAVARAPMDPAFFAEKLKNGHRDVHLERGRRRLQRGTEDAPRVQYTLRHTVPSEYERIEKVNGRDIVVSTPVGRY